MLRRKLRQVRAQITQGCADAPANVPQRWDRTLRQSAGCSAHRGHRKIRGLSPWARPILNPSVEPAVKNGKRPPAATRSVASKANHAAAADKKVVKTCLVANCGWPTHAELPVKRSAKR